MRHPKAAKAHMGVLIVLAVPTLFVGVAPALAASPPPLALPTVRLEDVIADALRGNPSVQREDERVRRAQAQLQQAAGAFDWNATAESGWERLYVPKAKDGVLTTELDTPSALRTVIGVGRRFRNGIEIQPGISFYTATSAAKGQTFGLTEPRPALNLTIPLLRGLGPDNQPAANERAAAATADGAAHSRTFALQRSVTEAVELFWRCLSIRQQLDVMRADQQAGDEYVSALRRLVAQGRLEPTALDRATANQSVQSVAFERALGTDQACRRDLALAMGRPLTALPVVVGEFPPMDGMVDRFGRLNEETLTTKALSRRQDLMALARYDDAEGERVKGARNASERRVDLFVDPSRVLVRLAQSFGGDVEQGQINAAIAAQNEARINFEQGQSQIRVDVADSLRNLRDNLESWLVLTRSQALLETVVADSERRRKAGAITPQDYRNAQSELAQARRQVIDAKLQYASSLAALRLATGTVDVAGGTSAATLAAAFRSLPEK